MLNWTKSKEDAELIHKIAARAVALRPERAIHHVMMDIEATHCNGCPLDLEKLLNLQDPDFSHDIGGILNHLDRETGQLRDCFSPRCSK